MAILAGDIKLVASQVMLDTPEGGGAPTPTIINDGASNAIFPDISELDRAGGRVNLRKVFASVQTTDTDTYLGANVIVADPPDDPNVSVAVFSTGDMFDRRDSAKNRVEAYLAPGPAWGGYLLENHLSGQRAIQLLQRPDVATPPIGHTLMLVLNEGLPNQIAQYVRILTVSVVSRTFTDPYNNYQDFLANVVTCGISDALRYDFPGSAPRRTFQKEDGKTQTRDTVVADAATYCGVVPTTVAVNLGALSAKVRSIFTQLVPSAQTEIPVLDSSAAGQSNALIDSSNGLVSYVTAQDLTPITNLSVGNSIIPGSLTIATSGGNLTDSGGDLIAGTTAVGTVDYPRGEIHFLSTAPTYSGSKTVTFKPGAAPLQLSDTAAIDITQETRSYNYVMTIIPAPAPGTLLVSYRSNGKWYDLRDNSAGVIKGADSAFGTGTVSYITGGILVTLGALPDAGSSIIYAWGSRSNYINRAAGVITSPNVPFQLGFGGVTPSSVTITWNDGTARTATDNGKGTISGDAVGTVRYQTGEIVITPTNLPAGGQVYTVDYTYGPPDTEHFPAPLRDGTGKILLSMAKPDLIPGTIELKWNLLIQDYDVISDLPAEMQLHLIDPFKTIKDDGLGSLKDLAGVTFGTVNYSTGAISFNPDTTIVIPWARYDVTQLGMDGHGLRPGDPAYAPTPVYRNVFAGFDYKPASASMPIDETGFVDISYRAVSSGTSGHQDITPGALGFDLTDKYSENIVPGSVNFTLGGKTYFDLNGSLYYDLEVTTGSAILAGTINYQTGEVVLSGWVSGGLNGVSLKSLLTSLDGYPVDEAVFRVPVAPVRSGSFQLLATRLQGGLINVTADTDGKITGTNVFGGIDYETGVVRVRFGAFVTAAGNESQPWYDAVAVDTAGKIFHPYPVFADSIKFNAVAYTYLPLDATILGLDPVRLPQDGRVAIFRPGGFAVIGNTKTISATVTNAQVIDCARVRLSRVRVIGNDGVVINLGYTADLEAGKVTFTDVTGYSQPVTVEHRVEDMMQVSDVQINGQLAFTRQVTHDYPIGSFVSSALIAPDRDLIARVSAKFDQATWSNVWADSLTGSAAVGKYNDVLNPIVVTNKGAVTERWALQFTNTNTFNVIGEHVGVIATGNVTTDLAPINPATGSPYFNLAALGWGSGWSAGNALRFNTVGALFPVWVVRTIQQGAETVIDDSFTMLIRGDVDRP